MNPFIASTFSLLTQEPEKGKSTFTVFKQNFLDYFANPETWTSILFVVLKIAVIYVIGRIVIRVSSKAISHFMIDRDQHPLKFDVRRTKTIGKLISNIISYTVNFVIILMILMQVGFEIGPLLAGAGVMGLAIGFGAQSLVKDVITGFFIIFEDQFAVGDVIQTGTFKGTVEEIGLRITRIKSATGEVHIIPNGSILQVTNFSLNNSIAIIDVPITYGVDIDSAIYTIKQTAMNIYEIEENLVKEPDVLGVQSIGANEVTIRVTCECKPNTQFGIARKMNEEIKKALDLQGIDTPTPKIVTHTRSERAES